MPEDLNSKPIRLMIHPSHELDQGDWTRPLADDVAPGSDRKY